MKTLAVILLIIGHISSIIKKPDIIPYDTQASEYECDKTYTLDTYELNDKSSIGSHLKDIVKIFANISDRSVYYYSDDSISCNQKDFPSGDDIYSFVIALEQNSESNIVHIYPSTFIDIIDRYAKNIIGVIHMNKNKPNQKAADFFICNQINCPQIFEELFTPTNNKISFESQIIKLASGVHIGYKDHVDMYVGQILNHNLETLSLIVNNKILINKIPQIGPLLE